MEFNKQESIVRSYKKLYESTLEQSVDTDFTLPDYYPEVQRILKIIPEINVMSSQCSNNGISIGGQVTITMLYIGSDEQMNSFSHIYPFTKSQEADVVDGGTVSVLPYIGYINSKAVGPRRVEVHGSIALAVTVGGIENNAVLCSTDCEGIYLKNLTKPSVSFGETTVKSVFIEDEFQLSQTQPSISKILRSNASAEITECKYVSEKTVLKGELTVEILYCGVNTEKPILLSEKRGFSQIVDCTLNCEEVDFDTAIRVESLELHPKTGLDGEVKNVSFEARVGLQITPYCRTENSFSVDAFSGKYLADIKYSNINVENAVHKIFENYLCKKKLDFGNTLKTVYDIWCKATVEHCAKDNADVLIKGTVNVSILGCEFEGNAVFFERPIEYEYRYPLNDTVKAIRCKPSVTVSAVGYSLSEDGTADISVELKIKGIVFSVEVLKAVSSIAVDFENTVSRDNDTAMILYYPENETVWDIALKYSTCPKKICEANLLDSEDTVCNSVLLIPNI